MGNILTISFAITGIDIIGCHVIHHIAGPGRGCKHVRITHSAGVRGDRHIDRRGGRIHQKYYERDGDEFSQSDKQTAPHELSAPGAPCVPGHISGYVVKHGLVTPYASPCPLSRGGQTNSRPGHARRPFPFRMISPPISQSHCGVGVSDYMRGANRANASRETPMSVISATSSLRIVNRNRFLRTASRGTSPGMFSNMIRLSSPRPRLRYQASCRRAAQAYPLKDLAVIAITAMTAARISSAMTVCLREKERCPSS